MYFVLLSKFRDNERRTVGVKRGGGGGEHYRARKLYKKKIIKM